MNTWLVVAFTGIIFATGLSQDLPDSDLYWRADSLYTIGEFRKAAQYFEISAESVKGKEKYQRLFLSAKATYRAGDYEQAKEKISTLLDKRLSRTLQASCHFFLGNIDFRSENLTQSVYHYIDAYLLDDNEQRRGIYLESLRPLFAEHLMTVKSEAVFATIKDPVLRSEIFCSMIEKYFTERRYETLIDKIDQQLSISKHQPCRDKLELFLEKCRFRSENIATVGVLAPQTGIYAPYGRSIIQATTLAFEELEKRSGVKVLLLPRDTKGEAITAAIATTELVANNLSAIIGPLVSASATSVISMTRCYEIPVVSPTASEQGLIDISDNYFQITPTVSTMFRHLADFAVVERLFDSIAVIYPDNQTGKEARDAFVWRARELGITVFFERSFLPTDADFRQIMLDLKQEVLPDTFDHEIFISDDGDTLETEEVVVNVQAIFIPAADYQLELIIPQVNFYKIQTTYLGGENWGSEKIAQIPEIVHRQVFFVDNFINMPEDKDYNFFYNKYQRRFGEPPDEVAAISYDAAATVANAIEAVGAAPEDILQYLHSLPATVGVTGEIKLNHSNENENVGIYKIQDGIITRQR